MSSNQIGSTGAVNIFRSLELNTSLEELDLSKNSQLAEGDSEAVGCAIERMLNVNIKLKVLNLSGCEITDSIVKCILNRLTKNISLATLDIRSPKLSGSCAVSLFQQMTNHSTLSITVREVNVLGVGKVKMDRGTLWCVIGDTNPENCVEFFRALNNSDLKVSYLNVQDLTDQTAEHFAVGLAEIQLVQALKLSYSYWDSKNISSAGAVSIFRLLEHNTNLEELDLSWNKQLAEGDSEAVGCAIERMLNVNKTLKVLNLSHCNVTDPLVKHILTGLNKNTSLVTLDIKSPKLSASCAVSLFQQMATNPTLSITVGEVNVVGVGKVKMDSGTLWCVMGDTIPKNCVEFFRALNNSGLMVPLKVSKLNVQNLTDQTAEHFAVGLAESQWVQALKLSHSYWEKKSISSAGAVSIFRSLEANTSLEELDLSGNSQLTEGDSEAVGCAIERMLNVNRTLKVLNLGGCGITNQVAQYFSNGLAQNCSVQRVVLCSNQVGSTGAVSIFRSLEHNTSLVELDLSENSQLAEGDSEAVGCAIERMLNVNRTLKVLNLCGCEITDSIVKCILTGLTKNISLVTLNVGLSKLSGSFAVSLFQQMATNPTLSITVGEVNVVGVGRVKMDRGTMWCVISDLIPENCVELFRALNNSGLMVSLKVSKLNVQNLTDQTAEHFAVGLAESQWVQALTLSHSYWEKKSISSAGAVSIFQSLEANTSLEELDLSWNSQLTEGDSEAVGCAIERMLIVNRTLKVLNLGGCGITNEVAKYFSNGLAQNCSVQRVVLHSNQVGSTGAVSIFRSLEHNTSLEELDISENSQLAEGDSEAVGCAIERMLNVNRTLKVLNLCGCEITDSIVKCILTGLTKNISLVTLNVGLSKLSGSFAVSLFQQMATNPTLSITVGEVNVVGVGRVKMDRGTMWCVISDLIPENCVELFGALNNSGLKVSKLIIQDLTDRTAEHFAVGLAAIHSVQVLQLNHSYLEKNNISSAGAVSIFRLLEHNTSLEELHLSENSQLAEGDSEGMGCAIERMLSVNKTLKVLNLSHCNVTDPLVKHILTGLNKNTSLVTLGIKSPKLSASCAVSLFQHMTTYPTLSIIVGEVNVLEVGKVKMDSGTIWCVMGDTIPKNCVEFFRALNNSGLMVHLKVSKLNVQNLTDQTAEHFAVGLAESQWVQALKLSHSYWEKKSISSAGAVSIFRSLEANTSLEELDLSGNSQLAESDSEAVGCAIERMLNVNRTLKVLNLGGCGITNEVAQYFSNGLAQNCSVQRVVLRSNQVGSTGAVSIFRSLEHNTSLEELDLSENSQLAKGDSEAVGCAIERMLNVNRTLKVLNLCGCEITDSIVKCILTGLTKNISLVTLNMGLSKLSGSFAVSLFQQMATNPTLSITVGEVNVVGVGRVMMERGTMWCVISDLIPENCVELFRALNNSGLMVPLKVSKLNVQNLTDQTAEHFAVGLAESQWVQALKLSHSYWEKKSISSAGAVSIFRSLEHNTSLEELDLSGNSQLTEGDSEAVGCAIERMLNVNRTLKVLNLGGCGITNEVAQYFSNGLAQNCSVQRVVLRSNQVGSTGAVSIFRSLEHNTSLEELDLSENSQLAKGDSEAVGCAIERMLNVNRTLKVLNLCGCEITDSIVKCILTGLTKNISLVTLNMRLSKLSGSFAVSLFQQMATNPTLSITVGEVNVVGVGRVMMDRGTMWCVISDLIPENCVEFFRALNNKSLKISNLFVEDLTDQTAKHFAVGLAESQSVQALRLFISYPGEKRISSTGAVSIFGSLEQNTSLEELDLSENSQLAEGDSEAVGCAIDRMLNVNTTLKRLNLSGCNVTDPIVNHILTGLTKNTSLVTLDIKSPKLSGSSAMSLFHVITNHPTLSITVGEVNVLGVGRVKMDRGTMWCVIGDLIPENCAEFFRGLNSSSLRVSKLNVQDLTDRTAEHSCCWTS